MLENELVQQATVDTIKLAPPAGVTVATFLGWSPEQWVTNLTITYLVLIITHHVWTKMIRPILRRDTP